MRASMGITRLLSLSLLLYSVHSQTAPTATPDNTSVPVNVSVATIGANTSGAATLNNQSESTQTTPLATTAAVNTPATVSVIPNATDAPASTQTQETTITISQTSLSGNTTVTANTITVTNSPTTPGGGGGGGVSSSKVFPVTVTPWVPLNPTTPSDTEVTVPPLHPDSTVAPTPGNQTMTISPSKTNQEVGKEPTTETTSTSERQDRTTKAAPDLGGSTISTPTSSSPLTKTTPAAGAPNTEARGPPLKEVTTTTTTAATPKRLSYSLNNGAENEDERDLVEVCKRLLTNLQDGNCTLTWRHHNGKVQFDHVEINGKVKTNVANEIYEDITKKPTDNKTLIAILASCGALLIMIVILAVCASHHRKPFNENQQHLTEELHTVENGYHDNPTLEVMEVQPEMQEKKMALNGEFNDSWIVPIDNLLKEDIPDEEDTHL